LQERDLMGFSGWILDLLFPPKCVFCRDILLQKGAYFCSACGDFLPFCPDEAVSQAGDFYVSCVTPLFYEGQVKDSIHRFKFQNARGYRRTYAALVAACVSEHVTESYDLITWAPVSKKRLRKRGYDQAEILAKEVAAYLDKPCVSILRKSRHAPPQSSLEGGRDVRKANIAGAYEVSDVSLVQGKRILLIDDVLTTGSTLSECARMLLLAGADEVFCAALARAPIWESQSLEEKVSETV